MTTNTIPSLSTGEILSGLSSLCEQLAVGVASNEAQRRLPYESVEAVRRSGLTTLRVPERFGGPDASLPELFGAIIAIAQADPNLAQALRSHFGFVEGTRARESEDDRARWLGEAMSGKLFGLAEAELGINDPRQWRTTLLKDSSGDLRLNGRKYYSTGSLFADWIEVVAVNEQGTLSTFVVAADREGVEIVDDFDAMGQRATASGTTIFSDVLVHPEEILRARDFSEPDYPFTYYGGFYQLYLASVTAGIAKNVFTDAADYVRTRARTANHSVAATASQDPYVLESVGEIGALAFAAESVVLRAAQSLQLASLAPAGSDAVVVASIDVAKAQLVAARAAIEAGQRIFETGGASTTSNTLNFSRHWRNARTVANHNPLAYKARATGDYAISGTPPPTNGYF
ncbi:MAG: acyl-CoA dehydrogenase family protein [Acidimicrobiales bacterium]